MTCIKLCPKDLLGLLLPNYFADDKTKKKVKKMMTFMSFDSKVDSCISPNSKFIKNNSMFQLNSLMDGLSDARKNIKNISESTLSLALEFLAVH